MVTVPPPDLAVEPGGFVVEVDTGDRIHFLDWGGPAGEDHRGTSGGFDPGVLLIHGLSNTAWSWAPVARRLRAVRRVVGMDLRGHGLSDAPTAGYDPETLATDALAVAEGSRLLDGATDRVVLAGHGFGAIVAAWTAAGLGARCVGLVLVDGGWESAEAATGMEVDEFLRGLDEPPEVMRSIEAFLADREAFDPASWDADQERAARATVVETHAGRVVPSTRPHAAEACVRAMFGYEPLATLAAIAAPVVALVAADLVAADAAADKSGARERALAAASEARAAAGREPIASRAFEHAGHNLMRYRPEEVCAAILGIAGRGRV
jgi:pimeloyl-ACP methyl ester carboxylesterase